ncbi:hypothetical protein Tco_1385885 [Tanacetum coccineum]
MPPRMMTRCAGRATAAPQGGRMGGQTVRGGGRTRGRSGDQGNGGIDGQCGQVGGQGNQGRNQGNATNQNSDAVNDNIRGDVRNVIENNDRRGFTYKKFLACNPKEYYVKGGAIIHIRSREAAVGMSWEDFKTLTREEFCPVNEMQKLETEFWNHGMVVASHAAYTDRFHKLARLVTHLVTLENKRIESTKDEAVRNARDENKRTRTGNAFATTTNPVRREYNGIIHKCVSCNQHHPSEIPCRACFNYGRLGHMVKDHRVAPRIVNLVNARNPTAAPKACYECGGTDHFKAACPRVNQAQRPGETVQTKLLLITWDKVVGTTVTRYVEGRLCWEQRRLARTRTS